MLMLKGLGLCKGQVLTWYVACITWLTCIWGLN